MALPLIGAQLLQMGNGLVDAIVAGRLGRVELAAGGIGATMWFFVSLLCIGLMAGLSPTLSELIGDRRRNAVGKVFRQGLWLGVITGVFGTVCLLLMHYYLDRTALDPELIPAIRAYLITSCWSMPAMAVILAARNVCEAVNLTRPVLLVQSLGLLVNIIVDLTLGLGMFGFPKLGMYGIGLATSAVMIVMAVVLMLLLTGQRFSRYNLFASFETPDWAQIKPLLVLSIPIFFALVFEACHGVLLYVAARIVFCVNRAGWQGLWTSSYAGYPLASTVRSYHLYCHGGSNGHRITAVSTSDTGYLHQRCCGAGICRKLVIGVCDLSVVRRSASRSFRDAARFAGYSCAHVHQCVFLLGYCVWGGLCVVAQCGLGCIWFVGRVGYRAHDVVVAVGLAIKN